MHSLEILEVSSGPNNYEVIKTLRSAYTVLL